jgi:hypothetical protein
MRSRQFPSFKEAIAYLEERGRLEYFGRAGLNYEYCVYNFHHNDGYMYRVNVYDNGKVEIRED